MAILMNSCNETENTIDMQWILLLSSKVVITHQ